MSNWKLLFASALFLSACDAPQDEAEDLEIADEEDQAKSEARPGSEHLAPGADNLLRPLDPAELPKECVVNDGGFLVCAPGGWGEGEGGGSEPGDNCGACLPHSDFEEGGRQWCLGTGYVGCDPYSQP